MSLATQLAPLGHPASIGDIRRPPGAHRRVDLIVDTLTNRRPRTDADIDGHLFALKSACRQTRRYREALPVLQRLATLNPRRRDEMVAEIALVHWHLGERHRAVAVLESVVTQQRTLPAGKRSFGFALVAEIAATVFGRRELAVECVHLGRSTVAPAPRRARTATKTHTATPAFTSTEATATPTATVGRPRAKGPVRRLSVLTAAA